MIKVSTNKDYWLVENSADIETVISKFTDRTIVAFDTETSGLNVRKDKIIGYSISVDEGAGFYVPLYSWNGTELVPHKIVGTKKLLEILSDKKLVMHNASFDTRITINFADVDLLSNLHADTMLMMHTLNEEGPFGLKEISQIRAQDIGFTAEDIANQEQLELQENVIKNGGQWKKTQKDIYMADLLVLAKYAIADTDLTLRLYNLFSKELKQQELHDFFYKDEVMPLYKKVTIPMEHAGVHLDMPKLTKLSEEIKQDIAAIEKSLTTAILESKEGQEFVRRLCEEVGTKVSGGFAQAVAEYYNLDLPKGENGKYSITVKTLKALPDSAGKTILENKSVEGVPEEIIEEIQYNILKKDGPLFNLNSKQQLGTLIFDIMGIKPLSTTEKGAPQFNEDMIEHLAEKNIVSWAKELRVYNKLVKISGSSYERFLEEQEEGVFYPYYKQHGTTSGRYSSNVQQLPRPIEGNDEDPRIIKYTNEIRALFISNPGYIFIDDDYASLEPSVFAHDAEDQPLLDIFIKGEDFYSKVAIMVLNLAGFSADKKAVNFLKNLQPKIRQDAKEYALGIRYGAEEGKLAQLLGIEKEEAKKILDMYFEAFPKLKNKMDQYRRQAKKQGMVRSEFGRVRHLPVAKEIYDHFGDDILDYSKMFDLAKKNRMSFQQIKDIRRTYKNLLNNALNFPIQSAATTVISRAVVAVVEEFQQKNIDGWVCGIIHDQAIYCVKEEQKEVAAEIVQRCMEHTTKLKVPLYAVPQFTHNFKDGH